MWCHGSTGKKVFHVLSVAERSGNVKARQEVITDLSNSYFRVVMRVGTRMEWA